MSSMSTTPASYLAGIGHPLDMTIAAGVNVVVNVAANVLLAPTLGATGAALSSTISYTVAAAVIIGYFRHRSGVSLRDLLVPQREDFSALYAGAKRALKRG
jgi:O-antigen/teichoic acid export membrane protein